MKKSAATQWILVILLFISYQFAFNAQTLDATFSSPTTTQCSGGLFTLNATTSSYQSYSWTISGPNAFTSNLSGSSTSLNLTEAGTYNVSLTVSDGVTSETNTVNGYLNTLTPAIADAGVDQTVCANSSVTLNGSVSGPATSIYWSGGTGTFSPNVANLTSTYSPSPSEITNGFVNLILTTNDPAGPCPADQDTVRIFFNSLPIVSAPSSICVGSTGQLSPSSGGIWTSSNNSIATINNSGLATGVNPGNVTFTFTNNTTGCSKTTNSVTINSTQSFNAQTTSICSGDSFSFTPINAQTGTTYTWSIPTPNPAVSGTLPGTNEPNIFGTLANQSNSPKNVVYAVTPSSGSCSGSSFTLTVTVNPTPTVSDLTANVCSGNSFTVSPVNMMNGIIPVGTTYTWSVVANVIVVGESNQTNPQASISQTLTSPSSSPQTVNYTVSPTSGSCSGSTFNVMVTVNPSPTFTLTKTDPTSCNATDGTITILGLTPNTSYQYSYSLLGVTTGPITTTSNSTGQITIFGLSAGSYTFSLIPTATGCQSMSQVITLVNPSPPSINSIADATVCGSFTLPTITGTNLSGNQAFYTAPNGAGGVLTGSISTSQTLFMYDITPGGCSDQQSFTVTVNPNPTITLSSSSVCVNSTVQLTPNSGGTWVSNNQSIASITNAGLVTGLAPGTVNFSYTNTTNGCVNTSNDLTVTSNATVDSIPNQVYCAGDITTPMTFSGSGQQYNWTNSNVNIGLAASGANTLPGFTTINTSGMNQVATITVIPVSSSCNATPTTFTITVKPKPIVTISQLTQENCHGAATIPVNFTSNVPGTSFIWTNNNNMFIQTNSVLNNVTSSYGNLPSYIGYNTLPSIVPQTALYNVIPNVNGCYGDTGEFTITVNPNPTINQVQNQTVCHNDFTQTIVFSGSNPDAVYNWSQDNTSIGFAQAGTGNISSFQVHNVTSTPQIATFTVTPSLNGCFGTAINFTITVNSSATVNPIPDQIVCLGELTEPITFSGSAQQYNWSNDNTSIGLAPSGTGNIAAFIAINTALINQVATITVTPISSGCNSTPITFTITVKPMPAVLSSFNQTTCHNGFTNAINFSGAINGTVYNWTNSNSLIGCTANGSGNIPSFIALNTTQNVQVAYFLVTPSFNGCYGITDTFNISVIPLPTINPIADQYVCHNDSTNVINFSGAINGTVYNWTNGNSSIGCATSGTGDIPSFQVQNTTFGSQIANFVVTPSLNGCLGSTINFDIAVLPLPIVNAGNDTTICLGESFTPIVTGNGLTFTWNNGLQYNTPFTPSFTNTYTVIGSNNTCSNSDSITVTVIPLPQFSISSFDGEDSLACDGGLSASIISGTAPYNFNWTNGATNYSTPSIQNLCSGTYTLFLLDGSGCYNSDSATINDTLIQNVLGDTLIFTDNIYQDSTIIGADTSAWIENCTFDYALVTGATIDSYIDNGDSTVVTWIVALSTGSTVSVDATYYMSPGTTGVYDLTLQLYCSAKSGPKFLVASSRLYYEASTIGLETHSLNPICLYPNPTKSTLSISGINSNFSYKIIDLQGKLLKQGANEKQIDIEHFLQELM
ncbi:MAG: hypothetical protein EBQ94_02185 [Flavobacteriales bacterium]|nr:hypothetical protein [Flavobacteriales bacterium]